MRGTSEGEGRQTATRLPARGWVGALWAVPVAALPLLLWVAAGFVMYGRAFDDAETDMRRLAATAAEHATRMLETHALMLDFVERVTAGRSCPELRADPVAQALMIGAVQRAPQTQALWVIDRDGYICLASDPALIDQRSRTEREYFTALRGADAPRYFVSDVIRGMISGLPVFSMARRRGEGARFDGVISGSIDVSQLLSYWRDVLISEPSERLGLYRADGAPLAQSWQPVLPERSPELDRRLARSWAPGAHQSGRVLSPFDGSARIRAWRALPGWNVRVVASISEAQALQPWRTLVLYSGLAATLASLLLGAVLVALIRARSRLQFINLSLEEQVAMRTAELQTIMAAAPSMITAKDGDGRLLLANPAFLEFVGRPWDEVRGRTDREIQADPRQAEVLMANDRRVMQSGATVQVEETLGEVNGRPRVWLSAKRPLRDRDRLIGVVSVSIEITERKRFELQLRLMIDELNHRVKNMLATVQSIAAQTLGGDHGAREALDRRLFALASTHDVLTRERWEGAELADVLDAVLAPHGGAAGGRFATGGPPLRLGPNAAVSLSMSLHELATNAVKYGALSQPGGHVAVRWQRLDGPPRLRLVWQEEGGPPVESPARRGFGSRLIERGLAYELGATVSLDFRREGLCCTIEMPLAALLPPTDGAVALA